MRTRILSTTLVVLGALVVTPAAATAGPAGPGTYRLPVSAKAHFGHKVVLFKSVAGVKMGMSPKQVKQAIGKPTSSQVFGGKIGAMYYRHGSDSLVNVTFNTYAKGDPVQSVATYLKSVHTSKGIRVGSSLKALEHAYKKKGLKKQGTSYSLFKGKQGTPGSSRTDFGVLDGKVVDIEVQKVFV